MTVFPLLLSGVFRADKISVPEALLLSLLGFAIVFVVLILLIIVIRVLTALTRQRAAAPSPVQAVEDRAQAQQAAQAAASGKVPAPGSLGECALHTVDDKTAALLMCIVADDLKAPLNELRFISIRQL